MALTLNGWKGLSMVVFTLLSLMGFALAVIVRNRAVQVYISTGVLFSAGVLIAGGMLLRCGGRFVAQHCNVDDHSMDHG